MQRSILEIEHPSLYAYLEIMVGRITQQYAEMNKCDWLKLFR